MKDRHKNPYDRGWWRDTFGSGAWLPLALILGTIFWLVVLRWILNF